MKTIEIAAQKRETSGKGPARVSRRAGKIPAILYGSDAEPTLLTLDNHSIERILKSGGEQSILSIKFEGQDQASENAIIKAVQKRTITSKVIHVDLLRISMDKPIQLHVPVRYSNIEEVKKFGAIIQHNVDQINIECLPANIPEFIVIDMIDAKIGHSITVGDIPMPEGVTAIDDEDEVVVSILAPVVDTRSATAVEGEGEEADAAKAKAGDDKSKDKEKAPEKKDKK